MGEKVSWFPLTKIVQVTLAPDASGEVDFNVEVDLYSDGKEDWMASGELNKWEFPVLAIGGQDLPGEKELGTTFFLNFGWRIRPYESTHVFNVNGNLYTDTGDSPFTPTQGTYNVMTIQQVSSLVDSTVAQLEQIEYASFNGGVTVDETSQYSGVEFPVGTPQQPVNNWPDALSIAETRGFPNFFILGDTTLISGEVFDRYQFVGESQTKTEIAIDADAQADGCEFYDAKIHGTLDGNSLVKFCAISDLNYIHGVIEQCLLLSGEITLGGGQGAHFLDCWSGAEQGTPSVNMGGSGQALLLKNYNGVMSIKNHTSTDLIAVDLNSGQITIEDTVTSGEVIVRGVGSVIDNSNGATVNTDYLVNPLSVADAVWQNADGAFLKSIEGGRWKIESNQMIFFEADNITEVCRFNLFDANGSPAMTDVMERQRV